MKKLSKFLTGERRRLHETVLANDIDGVEKVLEAGANVDVRDGRMRTALHVAALRGTTAIATVLVDKGAKLDARDEDNWAPLHFCSRKNSTGIAAMLVERGAELEAREKNGGTPLHICSAIGSIEIAAMLVERGAELEAREKNGATPLHVCSMKGSTEIAAMLVERGAELEPREKNGGTPLHICSANGSTEIAAMLMEKGVDMEARQKDGWAALHICSANGSTEIAAMLVERGVDLEAKTDRSRTPLHICSQGGSTEIAAMLMERGVDSEARDNNGLTPLHLCPASESIEIAAMLMERGVDLDAIGDSGLTPLHLCSIKGSTEIVAMLIDRGVDLEARATNDWTPLHLCSMTGSIEIAAMLMERGVDLKAKENDGTTPLHICSDKGSAEIAAMLMERGVDLEARDNSSLTPLHICSIEGSTEIAEMLMERGAELDAKASDGMTPLHMCSIKGSTEIAEMLMKKGANVNAITRDDRTALRISLQKGHLPVLKELARHGADIGAQDPDGNTALHEATRGNQSQALLMMLEAATEDIVNLKNKRGQTALHIAAIIKSEIMVEALTHSGAQTDISDNDGKTPLDYVGLEEEHLRSILALRKDTSIPPLHTLREACARMMDRLIRVLRKRFRRTSLQSPATQVEQKEAVAVAHVENPPMNESNAMPEAPPLAQHVPGTDEDEVASSSSSSDPGIWTPDEPYGDWRRLVNAVGALNPGSSCFEEFTIVKGNFRQRPHLLIAKEKFGSKQAVVLKFYWEEATIENTIEIHSKLASSEHVCKIIQLLKTPKTGNPPCIAFEKGSDTLCDWMMGDRSMLDRKWCLHQILTGLMEIHAEGIVHCDVKPSNVMFFPKSVTWKLIDFDGARKKGEQRAVCFTTAYAAPEVLRQWQEEEELPVAQPSLDIWSFGILAYKVLTGIPMFGEDFAEDEICEFVLDGKVEEKVDSIENESHREVLSNFLKFDPAERWSASDALEHTVFRSDPHTTDTTRI